MGNPSQKGHVPESPTRPGAGPRKAGFDVADLFRGPIAGAAEGGAAGAYGLDEKLRKAYFWMTNFAVITPFYDIEYNDGPALEYRVGDSKSLVSFPSGQSYSSFILLPLLTLVTKRRCLFIGGPGRGKTVSAILMGLLAGYTMPEVKRAIQHGQPQMTITDLLGNPLPSDLMSAQSFDSIKIAWRKWLGMRVKIIDEYNRIPTRTQSALLTVMADNYAEILDQVFDCPEAAWYLTANDDAGGGTYQVIEALRDRIDVVVRALHFNTRFVPALLTRIENGIKPEQMVPPEIVFSEQEIEDAHRQILEVSIPPPLMRRLEFFTAQFEWFEGAGLQFEYKTKDNVKLSGLDPNQLAAQDTGRDRTRDPGDQTRNGLSVRALQTCLVYIKALAYFRGQTEAGFEDVRNVLPFVLHDKLVQNPESPFFDQAGNEVFRIDRVSWIRRLFELSCAEFDKLGLDRADPVAELLTVFERGLEGVTEQQAQGEMTKIERLMEQYAANRKLQGPMFDDILTLKYLHQRYTNYLRWLKWKT